MFENLIYSACVFAKTLIGIVTFCLLIWGFLERYFLEGWSNLSGPMLCSFVGMLLVVDLLVLWSVGAQDSISANDFYEQKFSYTSKEHRRQPRIQMEPNLPQSKSVPANLATGRRHQVSISGTGSYQSHLSSLGHHRVRTHSEQISLGPIDLGEDDLDVLENGLAEQRPRAGRLCLLKQFSTDPATFLFDDLRRICGGHVLRPRALLTLYCCLCVVFLTIKVHSFFWEACRATRPRGLVPSFAEAKADSRDASLSVTSMMNVTPSQRLSIAFRGLSPRAHLDTFVLRAHPGYASALASDLTACFWIEDAHIEDALSSTAAWPGPVSLVVVTTHAPGSAGYKTLLGQLVTTEAWVKHPSANAYVHMLYVPSVAGGSSNAYLNMARFFARTSRVVLFPDGIPKFVRAGHARWLDRVPVDATQPVLLSNATQRGSYVPRLAMLAPVVLPRDHPVWCTERLYMFGSRALDWEDCVWQLWLESAGEASSIAVPHLLDGSVGKNATALSVPPHATKIRLRWSARYRSEACMVALKRSQAQGSLTRTEKRHMQWRKKFCRETGALDMS